MVHVGEEHRQESDDEGLTEYIVCWLVAWTGSVAAACVTAVFTQTYIAAHGHGVNLDETSFVAFGFVSFQAAL